jgi:TonB family protein
VILAFAAKPPPGGPELLITFVRGASTTPEPPVERFLPPAIGRSLAVKQDLPRVSALRLAGHSFALVRVSVGKNGQPTLIEVVKSGGRALDQAARADLAAWRFRPYVINSQPVLFHFVARIPPGQ